MADAPVKFDAFRDFERAGWGGVPSPYLDALGPLTAQAIEPLLDAADVGYQKFVLDVACGPGDLSAAAAKRRARVTAMDFAENMVAFARQRHPGLDVQLGDAEDLRYAHSSVDAVLCNFGMPHFAHPDRAMKQALRVLQPAGRYVWTMWCRPDEAVGFGIMLDAVTAHGNPHAPVPDGPPMFHYSDPAECKRAMGECGFERVKVSPLPMTWRLPSPDHLYQHMLSSTVRSAALLGHQTSDAQSAIRLAMIERVRKYQRGDVVELPMPCNLVTGTKP